MATFLSPLAQRFPTSDWTSEGKSERDETNPTFIRAKGCSRVWMPSSWRFLRFYPGIHKCRPVSLEHLHPSALCLILALMEESIINSLYRGNSSCFCTGACFSGTCSLSPCEWDRKCLCVYGSEQSLPKRPLEIEEKHCWTLRFLQRNTLWKQMRINGRTVFFKGAILLVNGSISVRSGREILLILASLKARKEFSIMADLIS